MRVSKKGDYFRRERQNSGDWERAVLDAEHLSPPPIAKPTKNPQTPNTDHQKTQNKKPPQKKVSQLVEKGSGQGHASHHRGEDGEIHAVLGPTPGKGGTRTIHGTENPGVARASMQSEHGIGRFPRGANRQSCGEGTNQTSRAKPVWEVEVL